MPMNIWGLSFHPNTGQYLLPGLGTYVGSQMLPEDEAR